MKFVVRLNYFINYSQQYKSNETPANHLHVVQTVSVENLMDKRSAVVYQAIKAHHHLVDQNALFHQNALLTRLVNSRNVSIHVLEFVEATLSAKSTTIVQFAIVQMDIKETHSNIVHEFLHHHRSLRFLNVSILVLITALVDRTRIAEQLAM